MESPTHSHIDPEATLAFPVLTGRKLVVRGWWLTASLIITFAYLTLPVGVTEIRCASPGTPLILAEKPVNPGDWPGYRGPTQQGVAMAASLQGTTVTQGQVPVWGHHTEGLTSAPCVWGTQVFFTQLNLPAEASLVCLQRETGALIWSTRWNLSPEASSARRLPIPTCDGDHVFLPTVQQGRLVLHAWTLTGQLVWSCDAGPWRNNAAPIVSPVISGPLVIVAADQGSAAWSPWRSPSYLTAIHRLTGKIVWRTLRPEGASAGVPVVATVAGRPQLILAGKGSVRSYDPATGVELWTCRWRSRAVTGGVVTDSQHVYAAGGSPDGDIVCIRADGGGDVTDTHVVWRDRRMVTDPIALTLADATLIHQQGDGTLLAVDATTGKMLWRKKLPNSLSTPALRYGSQLLCTDDGGTLQLLDIQRRGEVIYEASLGASVLASPAAIDSGLMISTNLGMIRLKNVPGPLVQEPRVSPQTR